MARDVDGPRAQRFWLEHTATLKPGAAVVVELERAQIHTLYCRPPRSELLATVVSCTLASARSREVSNA